MPDRIYLISLGLFFLFPWRKLKMWFCWVWKERWPLGQDYSSFPRKENIFLCTLEKGNGRSPLYWSILLRHKVIEIIQLAITVCDLLIQTTWCWLIDLWVFITEMNEQPPERLLECINETTLDLKAQAFALAQEVDAPYLYYGLQCPHMETTLNEMGYLGLQWWHEERKMPELSRTVDFELNNL